MKITHDCSILAAILLSAISVGGTVLIVDSHRNDAAAQVSSKLENTVVFAMPGGIAQDTFQKCAANDFTKKFNVSVEFLSIQTPQALARILVQRNSPSIDVMWSNPATDYSGFKEGVFIPITHSLAPNLANIDPKLDPEPDKGAVVSTSIQGISYNTKIFKEKGWEPPKSWQDLWDPKFKGHVAIYGLGGGSGQALIAVAGFLNGGRSNNYDAAFEYLSKLKPNLFTIFQQAAQYDAALIDGEAWIGINTSSRPLALMQQGSPVSFVQPSEGVVVNNLSLQIVKGAPHPNAAAAFVNWMLTKEAQSCMPAAGYPPVIKDVEVPPALVPYMTLQRNIIPLDAVEMQNKLPELLKRWNKEIDG